MISFLRELKGKNEGESSTVNPTINCEEPIYLGTSSSRLTRKSIVEPELKSCPQNTTQIEDGSICYFMVTAHGQESDNLMLDFEKDIINKFLFAGK